VVAGAAVAGLLSLAAGCGASALQPVIHARAAAAHEAIQPAAGEGSLGGLRLATRPRKPGKSRTVKSVPSAGGAMFGGNDGLVKEQGALGRKLAIVRVYYHIGGTFPQVSDRRNMAQGSTELVSLDSAGQSYASIAAGREDGSILAFLRSVNQAALQYHLGAIYITFEHEPDGPQHASFGSPAEFARAWDHVHQLAVAAHLDWNQGGRLHWVLIFIHQTYGNGRANLFWPGSGEVDIVAADGYNSFRCGNAAQPQIQTPAMLFNPLLAFAAAHGGLPAFIAEFGSDTSTPNAQPRFIEQMQAYLASNRQIAAALYWDWAGANCSYSVDGHPAALAALAALGRSAMMQGRALPAS
jgi:hypothetical protein